MTLKYLSVLAAHGLRLKVHHEIRHSYHGSFPQTKENTLPKAQGLLLPSIMFPLFRSRRDRINDREDSTMIKGFGRKRFIGNEPDIRDKVRDLCEPCPQCFLPWSLHPFKDGEYFCTEYQLRSRTKALP